MIRTIHNHYQQPVGDVKTLPSGHLRVRDTDGNTVATVKDEQELEQVIFKMIRAYEEE